MFLNRFALFALASLLVVARGGHACGQDDEALVELPDDPAAVVAYVGQTPVLLGDLMPRVEARIAEVGRKRGAEITGDELKRARVMLLRGMLSQTIQNKVMRECFLLEQIATQQADKRVEAKKTLDARARQSFFESEVPSLMKKYEAKNLKQLNAKLEDEGSSVAARQTEFTDQMLGHLYVRDQIERDPKVTIAEISEYYAVNQDDFKRDERARWEQLTVLFERVPDRDAAMRMIQEMGNEAFYGGSMAAVARAKSHEPFAADGGLHDWTRRGSLASKTLEQQIFTLPPEKMSAIIEDESGLHIVRVLEREPAGITPLAQVQDDIRETIKKSKIKRSQTRVIEKMRDRVAVWSIFPEDNPGAMSLREAATANSTFRR